MAKEHITAAPSVRRLPSYLNLVRAVEEDGGEFISSAFIARELDLEPVQVRKDISLTGILGKPQRGYPVEALIESIETFLGWDTQRDAVLIGVGNLGSALLGYRRFDLHGLHITAAFDIDHRKIGAEIQGVRIMNARGMDIQIPALGIKIAILTVPESPAQAAADMLVRAGIEGIWNFTAAKLAVPDHVTVQNEDMSSGYAMFCIKMNNKKKGDS